MNTKAKESCSAFTSPTLILSLPKPAGEMVGTSPLCLSIIRNYEENSHRNSSKHAAVVPGRGVHGLAPASITRVPTRAGSNGANTVLPPLDVSPKLLPKTCLFWKKAGENY